MNARIFIPAFLLLGLCACGSASAPQKDRLEGDWQVMVENPGKNSRICYAGSAPQSSTGTLTRRDSQPYLMVTRRPSGKVEVSASGGYAYMPGSKVELAADDNSYTLFFKGSVAWVHSDAEDQSLLTTLQNASDIRLMGVSSARLTSTDRYSSRGLAAAVARIRELCP